MSNKHTSGPWVIGDALSTGDLPIRAGEFGGAMVAVVDAWRRRSAANARLIAAAPDLLAALEEAAFWIEETAEAPDTGEGQAAAALLDLIRAAIAKATGED